MKKSKTNIIAFEQNDINLNIDPYFNKTKYGEMTIHDLQYFLKFEAKTPEEISYLKKLIALKK